MALLCSFLLPLKSIPVESDRQSLQNSSAFNMSTKLNLIAAACENLGIGINGDLPWRLKNEMAFFTRMTTSTIDPNKKNAVIMGRRTWQCIPLKYRPLKGRINIVLTTQANLDLGEEAIVCNSLESAMTAVNNSSLKDTIESLWVIGGSSVYKKAMESKYCHRVYLTSILKHFECDTFFPAIDTGFTRVTDTMVPTEKQDENGIQYEFQIFEKVAENN